MTYNQKIWFVLPMRCLLFITVFSFCSIITKRNLTEITQWWTCYIKYVYTPIDNDNSRGRYLFRIWSK